MLLSADQVRLEPVSSSSSDPKCFKSSEQNCVVDGVKGCRQVHKDQCSQDTGVDGNQDVR